MLWALAYAAVGGFGVLCLFRLVWWLSSGRYSLEGRDLSGTNVVLTGHTSGIGLATGEELARAGANLWLLCRRREAGEALAKSWEGGGSKKVIACDLTSLASVRVAAEEVLKTAPTIHVLLCNAGMGGTGSERPKMTEDGLETVMAANYFGHFLLTRLLLPKMSSRGRIISVSSLMHQFTDKLPMENLNFQREYKKHMPYVYSKLAQILFTRELAYRVRDRGIACNALHPGYVNTGIFTRKALISRILSLLANFFKNPLEGAQTSLYLAASPDVEGVSGAYFADCKPAATTLLATDMRVAADLWAESSRLCGLPIEL